MDAVSVSRNVSMDVVKLVVMELVVGFELKPGRDSASTKLRGSNQPSPSAWAPKSHMKPRYPARALSPKAVA
jgi:hypothetical protein